jgi:hypothetical protein
MVLRPAGIVVFLLASPLVGSELAGGAAAAPHRIRLSPLYEPQYGTIGVVVKARAGDRPHLRLLLDSGAEYLTLAKHAARKWNLTGGEALELVGAGKATHAARLVRVPQIEVGDIVFRDCPVAAVDGKIAEGIDGVIPLALFREFSIRLDAVSGVLDLEPYSPTSREPGQPVLVHRDLLFLPQAAGKGYLLLDTGSAFDAVSEKTQLRGLTHSSVGRSPIPLDLRELSRRHGIEICGVIGYPTVARSVLTVNYREGLVRIEPK